MLNSILRKSSIVKPIVSIVMIWGFALITYAKSQTLHDSANVECFELDSQSISENYKEGILDVNATSKAHCIRNKVVDEKIMNLAENPQEIDENKNYLDMTYDKYGSFWAMVDIQLILDDILIGQALLKYRKDISKELATMQMIEEDFGNFKEANPFNILVLTDNGTKIDVDKMVNEMYNACTDLENYLNKDFYTNRRSSFAEILSKDSLLQNGKPDFKTTSNTIDKLANDILQSETDIKIYLSEVKKFIQSQNSNGNEDRKLLNLLSYKIYLIDSMVLKNHLKTIEYFKNNEPFNIYLQKDFYDKKPIPIN